MLRTLYLDTSIISAYVDEARKSNQVVEMAALWGARKECRFETSAVAEEEAADGDDPRLVHRRLKALSHIRMVKVHASVLAEAMALCERCVTRHKPAHEFNQAERNRARNLLNDARHFIMAARMGSTYLVTYDMGHFRTIAGAYIGKSAPKVLHPADLIVLIHGGPMPKRNPAPSNTPRRLPDRSRAIVAEIRRIQFRIAKRLTKGWFDKPRPRPRKARSA